MSPCPTCVPQVEHLFLSMGCWVKRGTLISKGCFLLWFTISDHQSKNETKAEWFIGLVKVPLHEAQADSELPPQLPWCWELKYAPPHWLPDHFWKTRKSCLFDNFLANFTVSAGPGKSLRWLQGHVQGLLCNQQGTTGIHASRIGQVSAKLLTLKPSKAKARSSEPSSRSGWQPGLLQPTRMSPAVTASNSKYQRPAFTA